MPDPCQRRPSGQSNRSNARLWKLQRCEAGHSSTAARPLPYLCMMGHRSNSDSLTTHLQAHLQSLHAADKPSTPCLRHAGKALDHPPSSAFNLAASSLRSCACRIFMIVTSSKSLCNTQTHGNRLEHPLEISRLQRCSLKLHRISRTCIQTCDCCRSGYFGDRGPGQVQMGPMTDALSGESQKMNSLLICLSCATPVQKLH